MKTARVVLALCGLISAMSIACSAAPSEDVGEDQGAVGDGTEPIIDEAFCKRTEASFNPCQASGSAFMNCVNEEEGTACCTKVSTRFSFCHGLGITEQSSCTAQETSFNQCQNANPGTAFNNCINETEGAACCEADPTLAFCFGLGAGCQQMEDDFNPCQARGSAFFNCVNETKGQACCAKDRGLAFCHGLGMSE